MDIVELFEQTSPPSLCPFGHDWCGEGNNPCPLHDTILEMVASNRRFMHETRLSVFEKKLGNSGAIKRNLVTLRERA